jgi:hypothetical protein
MSTDVHELLYPKRQAKVKSNCESESDSGPGVDISTPCLTKIGNGITIALTDFGKRRETLNI